MRPTPASRGSAGFELYDAPELARLVHLLWGCRRDPEQHDSTPRPRPGLTDHEITRSWMKAGMLADARRSTRESWRWPRRWRALPAADPHPTAPPPFSTATRDTRSTRPRAPA